MSACDPAGDALRANPSAELCGRGLSHTHLHYNLSGLAFLANLSLHAGHEAGVWVFPSALADCARDDLFTLADHAGLRVNFRLIALAYNAVEERRWPGGEGRWVQTGRGSVGR